MPAPQRSLLVPALPVIGAASLVVALHLTGLFLPVRVGIWVVVALCVASLVMAAIRRRIRALMSGRSLLQLGLMSAVGAAGALLALLPSINARSPLAVQATASNDAFYYVSVADWLSSNAITRTPVIGVDPSSGLDSPVFGPAAESLRLGLRVGQELVHAGVSDLLMRDPVSTFSPMLAVYLLILPGGAWVLGAAFRMSTAARVFLGLALVTTFTLLNQVQNQNADSILGIAFVPLVLGLAGIALFHRMDDGESPEVPSWLAGISLSALIGTYTEYAAFVFAVLGFIVLVGPLAEFKRRIVRALAICGLALLVGPFIWFRAVQGTILAASLSTQSGAKGSDLERVWEVVSSPYVALSSAQPEGTVGALTLLALSASGVVLVVGVILALVIRRSRGLAIGVLVAAGGATYIGLRGNGYITGRAADMLTPLLIIAAVVGLNGCLQWWAERTSRSAVWGRAVSGVASGVVVAVVVFSFVGSYRYVEFEGGDDRFVSNDFAQAADWVESIEEGDGANVTVATSSMFEQLWITDSLRDLTEISYVSLRGDLGYRADLSMTSYWDREPDRYVLVGPGAFYDGDSAVIDSNSTFTLLDMTKPASVAVPVVQEPGPQSWFYSASPGGPLATSGQGIAAIDILTSRPDLAAEALEFTGLPDGAEVLLAQDGSVIDREAVSGGGVRLDLANGTIKDGAARVTVQVVGYPSASFAIVGLRD